MALVGAWKKLFSHVSNEIWCSATEVSLPTCLVPAEPKASGQGP